VKQARFAEAACLVGGGDAGYGSIVARDEDELPVMTGRAWVFADFLRAEDIVPPGIRDLGEAARSLFAALDEGLAAEIQRGDVLVAGSEFACGDGGVQAARALRRAGIAAVIARTFAAEFAAEAIAIGLPAVFVDETQMIRTGDRLRLDVEGRRVVNLSSGDRYPIRDLSDETVRAWRAGGALALAARSRKDEAGER
jgi:3-isopropylmalate/(R)-2-methylmalate dehydratase small subunit